MRSEALNHKYVYGTPIQGNRLVLELADMHQKCTQSYVRRPYGVGLLIAICDQTGPHLYVTEPSGNYFEFVATAIGSRSQASKTYLERVFETLDDCSKDDLIKHALKAIDASLAGDSSLDSKSVSICVVGTNHSLEMIEGADLQKYLDTIEVEAVTVDMETDIVLESPEL